MTIGILKMDWYRYIHALHILGNSLVPEGALELEQLVQSETSPFWMSSSFYRLSSAYFSTAQKPVHITTLYYLSNTSNTRAQKNQKSQRIFWKILVGKFVNLGRCLSVAGPMRGSLGSAALITWWNFNRMGISLSPSLTCLLVSLPLRCTIGPTATPAATIPAAATTPHLRHVRFLLDR